MARPNKMVDGAVVPLTDAEWAEYQARQNAPVVAPVPGEVSAAQAKTALYHAGLYDDVEAKVAASEPLIRIWWSSAQAWRRDHPYIVAIAAELGLSDDQVDALFVAAAAVPT